MTDTRLPKPALITTTMTMSGIVSGNAPPAQGTYSNWEDALLDTWQLGGSAGRMGAESYATGARLQAMMEEGPLSVMDELEFGHWMRCLALKCGVVGQVVGEKGVGGLKEKKKGLEQRVKVCFGGVCGGFVSC